MDSLHQDLFGQYGDDSSNSDTDSDTESDIVLLSQHFARGSNSRCNRCRHHERICAQCRRRLRSRGCTPGPSANAHASASVKKSSLEQVVAATSSSCKPTQTRNTDTPIAEPETTMACILSSSTNQSHFWDTGSWVTGIETVTQSHQSFTQEQRTRRRPRGWEGGRDRCRDRRCDRERDWERNCNWDGDWAYNDWEEVTARQDTTIHATTTRGGGGSTTRVTRHTSQTTRTTPSWQTQRSSRSRSQLQHGSSRGQRRNYSRSGRRCPRTQLTSRPSPFERVLQPTRRPPPPERGPKPTSRPSPFERGLLQAVYARGTGNRLGLGLPPAVKEEDVATWACFGHKLAVLRREGIPVFTEAALTRTSGELDSRVVPAWLLFWEWPRMWVKAVNDWVSSQSRCVGMGPGALGMPGEIVGCAGESEMD